jgi:DNA-binding MarR family transcriptional regulator
MQATTTKRRKSSSEELARELYTFLAYLLSTSTPDFFRALSEADVTLTQVKLLHLLAGTESELSLKDIAEEMSFSLAGVSRSIEALHQRGLVERREDEKDRRMKRVRIASEGRDLVRSLNEMRVNLLAQFVDTIPDPQRRVLLDALSPIVEREDIAAFRPEA